VQPFGRPLEVSARAATPSRDGSARCFAPLIPEGSIPREIHSDRQLETTCAALGELLGSRTAPCKTFAGAISNTAAGGEIDVLDPGGFGALTITKAITIDGGGGRCSRDASRYGAALTAVDPSKGWQ
jgi:hypothetical protein